MKTPIDQKDHSQDLTIAHDEARRYLATLRLIVTSPTLRHAKELAFAAIPGTQEMPPTTPASTRVQVRAKQVVQLESGIKYVAGVDHTLPRGAQIVALSPHADGDYSYLCYGDGCQCMQ